MPIRVIGWGVGTAGAVAYVTDSGTFCVYSPLTKGQEGECLSCSDLQQSNNTMMFEKKISILNSLKTIFLLTRKLLN